MIYNFPVIFNTTFDIVTPNEMKTKEINSVVSKLNVFMAVNGGDTKWPVD